MISLGRRDARKELGLGFGGGREMEDTELEEGEACSDHNNIDDGYDASVDPDIALSYIDVKLQNVLGHFQKDFEGGVSAENLGAKFGGYGSFLPTHQRSPVWPHPRTPPKNQNYNTPRSPNSLPGIHRISVSSSASSQSVKLEPASASVVSLTAPKASSTPIVAVKQEACMLSDIAKDHALRCESVGRKSTKPDQKLLKVRIKVGSDNLSTQKNAAIYSGLGLDVSPSSSLDDSPSGSEGVSHGPQDSPFESPTHILQTMTSLPVRGSLLLSPLSDHLIQLTEKVKLHKCSVPFSVPNIGSESSGIIFNGSVKGDGKISGEKKTKLLERNEISAEPKSENNKDSRGGFNVSLKEVDLDTLACEDLVSNTLKLPLLSNSYSAADAAKSTIRSSNISREVSIGVVRDKNSSDLIKEEPLGPVNTHEGTWVENPKATSSGKIWEDKKASSLDNFPVYPRKDSQRRGEKPYGSVKSDSNISKGMKTATAELTETLKQKADQKFTPNEQEGTKFPSGKERLSSDGKKKLKGSQSQANVVVDMPKDGLIGGSSSVAKNKKSTSSDEYITRGEMEDSKLQKNAGKSGDRYKDFFGDFELDQEENQMSPLEMSSENRQKDSEIGEKSTRVRGNTIREGLSGRKSDRLPTTEVHRRTAPSVTSFSGNEPTSDAAAAAAAPAGTADNWVGCDKCQKWRLLPLDKNPDDLPEKWVCSMLNWLPGMNQCRFSEEETNSAVNTLNQVSAMASQNNLPANPGRVISSTTMAVDQLDQNHQNSANPSGGKKKTSKDGTSLVSNSMKKSIHASITNGSLNEMSQPMVSEQDFPKVSKTSDSTGEKHKHRQKEKLKVLDNCSDGGDSRKSKMKGKRDREEDLFSPSKKFRAEVLPEDWVPDHVSIEKVGPSSSNGLLTMSSGKNLPKSNARTSSKDESSARKSKDKVAISLDDAPMNMGNRDDREVGKKRKLKGSYDSQVNTGFISDMGNNLPDSRLMAREEFSDNEYRKEKKTRVSRSDGKESSASKGSGKTDRKGSHRKNQQLGKNVGSSVSQRNLDGVDFSKRDSGSMHPSVAATSSSSKVSGSHKTKANFHETKGSPVESVSSSPLRVSKQSKLISGQRNFTEKDDSSDAGFFALGGLRRCLDAEDDGGSDRSGAAKKEKIPEVAHHGSHESSVLDFQEKDFSRVSSAKAKQQITPSPDITNHHLANGSSDYLGQDTRYSSKTTTLERCRSDDRQHENHVNGSRPRKSGKGSSSRSKDKNRNFNSELENVKFKVSDSVNEQARSFELKPTDGKNKNEEMFGVRSDESETRYVDNKDSIGPLLSECNRKERGKSPSLPPFGSARNEKVAQGPQPLSGSLKGNGVNVSVSNASDGDNLSKAQKQIRKVDHPNGTHQIISRDSLSNGHRAKDFDARSPVKRESSSQSATNALKEAKDLKHLADRLKNSGSNESTKFYFEACLKFLHGASLLETCSSENAKSGEMIQSMQVYSSTAKLCEFCAHEYEKSKDMAAASLAYKCMEVAYMRVIYSSHYSANKDRNELQNTLQMVPPGESPSSSASDVDNLNHPATTDKGTLAKSISSPQVTGSHAIAPRNRPNFVRLLNFTQDVNFAMEATRKSLSAFAAANASLGETQCRDGIASIKTALDFNFHDVEGLLHLVRLAIEAISPQLNS